MSRPTQIFGILAIICNLSAIFPYVLGLAKQQTKPHFITWLIWTITNATAFFAQLFSGAGAGAWPTLIGAFVCGGATISGLLVGEKTITHGDWLSLIFALLATPLWIITKSPLYSVILVSLIDLAGYYPTLRKSWNRPYDEPIPAHSLGLLNQFFAIFAVEKLSLVNLLYPIVCFFPNLALVSILTLRRRVIAKPTALTTPQE